MDYWQKIQRGIDGCEDCLRFGVGLIHRIDKFPARPPTPKAVRLLFLSEAPPTTGGFWAAPPTRDDLRDQLFAILHQEGVSVGPSRSDGCLEDFTGRGYFLLQTVKWPLLESARNLRRKELLLIDHSVDAHLRAEVAAVQPTALIPMGRVACYAAGRLFGLSDFAFARSTKLEQVRGHRFTVRSPELARPMTLVPTGLPVRRRSRDFPTIRSEVAPLLKDPR